MVLAFGKSIKKDQQVTSVFETKCAKKERESQDVSVQIPATVDFDVWSTVRSRVSIGLAETREVSKESTEVDNEQLQTYLQRASISRGPTASLYVSAIKQPTFFRVYWNRSSICTPFEFRVTQKRENLFCNLEKVRTERARHEMFYRMSVIVNVIGNEVDFLNPIGLKSEL